LAVINKTAGHDGARRAGATDDTRNRGTLVNARCIASESSRAWAESCVPALCIGWTQATSGLIVVAKNDQAHRALGRLFPNAK